jgi:hypothetical protein
MIVNAKIQSNELTTLNSAVKGMNNGVSRAQILELQNLMQAAFKDPWEKDFPVEHIFAPGLYARQMTLPKGGIIIGKIHRHAHVNLISKGRVWVVTEFGKDELIAPVTFVSKPGTKRVVVAQEETIWTTFHPTEETDLQKIEDVVIAPTYDALEQEMIK